MKQAGENVMAILPHGFGDDNRSIRRNALKDVHAVTLAVDKTVRFFRAKGVSSFQLTAKTCDSCRKGGFHSLLCGPTLLIGGKSQVSAREEINSLDHSGIILILRSRRGFYF